MEQSEPHSGNVVNIQVIDEASNNVQTMNDNLTSINIRIEDHPNNFQEIELNDFIINIEDSDNRSNKQGVASDMNSIRIVTPTENKNHFDKNIVVLSNTEEKKEEVENLQYNNSPVIDNVNKCDSGSFVNIINPNQSRNSNPRQKKLSIPLSAPSENESVLFFFVNPLAGVGDGKHLINMGVKKVEFTDNLHCTAYVFNMKDETNCSTGVETLRSELSRVSLIRVIIGGGDGSVFALIEKLNSAKIDVNRCIFGVLPLGRSNDLSRALGWGDMKQFTSDMAKFKLTVQELAEATSIFVDVWELKLTCDQTEGEIIEYTYDRSSDRYVKHAMCDSENKKVKAFKKNFINYFSLGFDARVGFGANKYRSKCRCGLLMTYFWEAMKKHCCRKSVPVNNFIESFSVVKFEEENDFMSKQEYNQTVKENEAAKDVIFKTVNQHGVLEESIHKENSLDPIHNYDCNSNFVRSSTARKTLDKVVLKGNPVGLVCQNINYFIGGNGDVWRNSVDNFGLKVYEPGLDLKDKKAVEFKNNADKEKFRSVFKNTEQKLNDQKLEFFTYSSTWKLGSLKVTSKDAEKVYQGGGPIIVNFKDTPSLNDLDKYNRVYLNLDSEYFHIVKPKEARVRLARKFNGGKLKLLQKL